jgi:hypothetical protein
MGFRFRRTFKIIPGVRLNVSKSGTSISVGARGAHYTISGKGTRITAGIPGSGLSWTQYRPFTTNRRDSSARSNFQAPTEAMTDGAGAVTEFFESSPVDEIVARSTNELTQYLNKVRSQLHLSVFVLALTISVIVIEGCKLFYSIEESITSALPPIKFRAIAKSFDGLTEHGMHFLEELDSEWVRNIQNVRGGSKNFSIQLKFTAPVQLTRATAAMARLPKFY